MIRRMHIAKEIALLMVTFAVLGSCSGGGSGSGGGGGLPKPLAERYVIDGVVDLASVGTVHQKTIDILDSFGTGTLVQTSTLRWAAANDDRNLYIALEWDDVTQNAFDPAAAFPEFDGIAIMFDNDGDGTFDLNEDAHRLVAVKSVATGTVYGSSYSDIHSVPSGPAYVADDTVGDGLGKLTYSGGKYHAEFVIPLTPDAAGEDGVLNANTRFNVLIYDNIQPNQLPSASGNIGVLNGIPSLDAGTDASTWTPLPYTTPGKYDQPVMPSNLTGLIVFISDHENPLGELYTFDPSISTNPNRIVTRVTNSTGLYMDCASLSHDHTKIAVHAGSSWTDFANFEIYTVPVSSGTPTRLTFNAVLDGHPAWSPNDQEIVYASFYDTNKAKLIVSTATGSVINDALTPPGWNDNDPDWLPDGRIVFKTDRFGAQGAPTVRIAVMNKDGSNVGQLSYGNSMSDHDPSATSTVAVFERFMKDTDYSQDPSFVFSPWNIVEARLDGSGERTLVSDGWINWLPVHDPTGHYLVYLKTVGYTDARLMNANGRDLGRLISGITKIRYIDWK